MQRQAIAFCRGPSYHRAMRKPSNNNSGADQTGSPSSERIAKRMARAGLCSRREAEAWITAGRVRVNGKLLDSPALTVTATDRIEVDGKPLPDAEPMRLWRYHKPEGLVTTNRDPEGRTTIYDRLPAGLPRVISIGRLDLNSEGLLLLTNDGETARRLELPTTGWSRKYRVRVHGKVDPERLKTLAKGVEVDGIRYGAVEAELERQVGANAWVTVAIREGKNREVRKVMESIGLTVNRLIRVSYGPFQLGHLARGAVEEVPARVLADQLGKREAGSAETKDESGRAKAKEENRPQHRKPRHPGGKPAGARSGSKPDAAASGKPRQDKAGKPARTAGGKPARPAGGKPADNRRGGKPSASKAGGNRGPNTKGPNNRNGGKRGG
jgi:23S rRNA pseudouridine2605 synthase